MPELASEERIAALEAENARLLAALEEAQINFQLQQKLINIPRLAEAERKVYTVLSGDDSALQQRLDAARHDGRMDQVADDAMAWQRAEQTEQERDLLRAQLAEADLKRYCPDCDCVTGFFDHDDGGIWETCKTCNRVFAYGERESLVASVRAQLAERDALLELIVRNLEEAGGTLDDKLRLQIIHDPQQDIRQSSENALTYWKDEIAERDATIASLQRRIADNLCYLKPGEALDPMLPKDQHMESCSRFYDQEVGKRGVVAGCMTIAQLEEALAQSEDLFKEAEKSWSALARKFRDEHDQLAAQVERLRSVADDVVQGGGIADLEDARAVLAETPAASLAAVREQARREALEEVSAHCKSMAESNRKKADRARANRDDLNFERHGCVSDVMFVEEAYWRELAAQPVKEPRS